MLLVCVVVLFVMVNDEMPRKTATHRHIYLHQTNIHDPDKRVQQRRLNPHPLPKLAQTATMPGEAMGAQQSSPKRKKPHYGSEATDRGLTQWARNPAHCRKS
jgi:hypothetical protein